MFFAADCTVLVVEDEHNLRWLVAEFLSGIGFHVVQAGCASEAIKHIENGLAIDAVFSDINLPGPMDGIGLAHWLRRVQPTVKIVLTSSLPQADAADLCDGGPVMMKPCPLPVIAVRLLSVCTRENRNERSA